MQEEQSASGKGPLRQPNKDISSILRGWEYEPGTVSVRKIMGTDGLPKLQMRLDLGLLQMELNGRPDGVRPHGCDSLLEYFERRLRKHRRANGTELGFHLTPPQCQSLREEALMYYHRYLSLFVLGEYDGVARDTERNLRVLDLCSKYAVDEQDRLVLEQYRPYIIMMNARALASVEFDAGNYVQALAIIRKGLRDLKSFFRRFNQEEAYKHANEVRVLKRFGREISAKLPVDPVRKLKGELDKAVKEERYEDAARMRDELGRLEPGGQGQQA
jgi:hypothetical protein